MKNETEKIDNKQGNGVLPCVSGSVCFETETLPKPQSCDEICNTYYLVKVKGYASATMAMFLIDENGETGWYINYYAKIVKEVVGWANV